MDNSHPSVRRFELAVEVHEHFCWPVFSRDPNNPPELISITKRRLLAALVGTVGVATGLLFWVAPSKSVTRLALDLKTRELIIRTAAREFPALIPRDLYPAALRKTAEAKGWYKTPLLRERVVPLSSVYRIRGSAMSSTSTLAHRVRSGSNSDPRSNDGKQRLPSPTDERTSIEIKPGLDRWWYTLEASGGNELPKGTAYARFWQRVNLSLRGHTDWSEDSNAETIDGKAPASLQAAVTQHLKEEQRTLGAKEPWFADRRTFDDIIPFVKRR